MEALRLSNVYLGRRAVLKPVFREYVCKSSEHLCADGQVGTGQASVR